MLSKLFAKNKKPELNHIIYMNKGEKYKQIAGKVLGESDMGQHSMIIFHFDQTGHELTQVLNATGKDYNHVQLISAKNLLQSLTKEKVKQIIVAEIHPMGIQDETIQTWKNEKYPGSTLHFYTSLDNSFLKLFGGENVIQMMYTLGMEESDQLNHPFINKAIANAQSKIRKKVLAEKNASSEEEWIKLNIN